MNELSRHIEFLLLRHDCVIVPDFGGFVSHRIPAQLDENDMVMLPPSVTVGFNPNLKVNDSLLVQQYIEVHNFSYPEALRTLEEHVTQVKKQISEQGAWEIHSVGKISINQDGNYSFIPCEAGIATPALYGLSVIDTKEFTLPKDKAKNTLKIASKRKKQRTNNSSGNILHKIAAAIIVLLALSLPFLNHNGSTQNEACVLDSSLTKDITTNQTICIKQSASKIEDAALEEKENTHVTINDQVDVPADSTKSDVKKTTSNSFTIVLASKVTEKNAIKYIQKLSQKGYDSLEIIPDGKYRKVVMGKYTTKEQAVHEKRILNRRGEMPKAWILELKEI